jgi:hypothetical protein
VLQRYPICGPSQSRVVPYVEPDCPSRA